MSNKNLHKANKAKNDEFYTGMSDIAKELHHYKTHFKGKVVFCNCDDPKESHFWKFFMAKFGDFELKKLISTHYDAEKKSYKLETTDGENEIEISLEKHGDFRDDECVEILKEADIIVTNPPFSLFREYLAQLVEYEKKFLIIGSMNAITYKETFKLIKSNEIWLGCSAPKKFIQPDGSTKVFGNIGWFTNLEHKKRHEPLVLYRTYNTQDYPQYDNYDAIEVSKTKDIPMDYEGMMGVPISFLDKYSPEQFEIVTAVNGGSKRCDILGNECKVGNDGYLTSVNGKIKYDRIIIKNRNPQKEVF